jgi:cytochrome c
LGLVRWQLGAIAISLGVASVSASAAPDFRNARTLAKQNACMGCHAVDRKVVGPAFKDVAAKYRGDPDAVAKLTRKVRDGGAGVWGQLPMPPHPRLSTEDTRLLVEWVLSGAPST